MINHSEHSRRRYIRLALALLACCGFAACSTPAPPPPAHPAGELYLGKPPVAPPAQPSTDNDPNGGAN